MYVCRLFHRDQPFEQLDARLLGGETAARLSIGRDPAADWSLDDAEGILSRIHFTLACEDDALTLTDSSTNGTFLPDGARAPRGTPVPLAARDTVRFGALTLLIDRAADGGAPDNTRIMPAAVAQPMPREWLDAPSAPAEPRPPHRDESLIEAFCEGAKLDSSGLSGEDPADLMRRVGALYQQTVLGLATLMAQRAAFKGDHDLDRTTIGATDNNPFKWAPTRKLAMALLRLREPGFLSDADAVRACFEDIAHHLDGVAAGGEAALRAALDHLSPQAIETEAEAQGFSLRSRAAVYREVHAQRHAALAAGAPLIGQSFGGAYDGAARA